MTGSVLLLKIFTFLLLYFRSQLHLLGLLRVSGSTSTRNKNVQSACSELRAVPPASGAKTGDQFAALTCHLGNR